MLNYCGIRTDLLDFTVDRNPYKQGKFPPGTHIPILAPEAIAEARPDYVLILPWNLKDEISRQAALYRRLGRALRRADPRGPGVRPAGRLSVSPSSPRGAARRARRQSVGAP